MSKDDSVNAKLESEEVVEGKKKMNLFGNLFTKEKTDPQNHKKSLLQRIGIQNLCILLVLGILLIFLCFQPDSSTKSSNKESSNKTTTGSESLASSSVNTESNSETEEYVNSLESKLQNILSKVNGVGDVEVMITLEESKERIVLKDSPYTQDSVNESDGEGGIRESNSSTRGDETVMSSNGDGETTPYIIKEIQPSILGVLIIAEGGNNAVIETKIVQAVEALFDVPAHKIVVMEKDSGK